MKIAILTEGGLNRGLGHVARCSALYQSFCVKGFAPQLIVNGDKSIAHVLPTKKVSFLNWVRQEQRVCNWLKVCDIVVIDSYLAPLSFYRRIATFVRAPVYFDDDRRLNYPRGIIINGTLAANRIRYDVSNQKNVFLLGKQYFPLRKEFWTCAAPRIRTSLKTIFLTLGGGGHPLLQPLRRLLSVNLPGCDVIVAGNRGAKHQPSSEQIHQYMMSADLAISGGGQTLYELTRVGIPTIAIKTADNQRWNIEGLKKTHVIEYAGPVDSPRLLNRVSLFVKKLQNIELRRRKQKLGRSLIDGRGAERIVDFVLNFKRPLL